MERIHSQLYPKNKTGHGLFITIEGGEGSGKSTLIEKICDYLTQKGHVVVKTREPGGTQLGESIRQFLLTHNTNVKISAESELLLFLSARVQHIEEIISPAIRNNKIVLCDRFNDSTIAYQGFGRNLGYVHTKSICDIVSKDVQPDLTFFLDVDPNVGLSRTRSLSKENAKAGDVDRIESEALTFHQRVREGFYQLAKDNPQRIVIINTDQTQDAVYQESLRALEKILETSKIP